MDMRTVSTKEFEKIVIEGCKRGWTIYGEGVLGNGKSTIVNRVAKELGMECKDSRLSTMDVGDIYMRMPNQDRTKMVELINENLMSDKPCLYLFDEFRHATNGLRRASYQPIHDRRIGSYKMPSGSCIVALSNPTDEVDTEELEAPLIDRFDVKVKIEFDFKEWKEWAFENEVRPEIISFLEMFKENVINTKVGGIPLSPRTWVRLSKNLDTPLHINMLPDKTGAMLKVFLEKINIFKDVDSYLTGAKKMPKELDMQYAFISAVVNKVSNDKKDGVVVKWFADKMDGIKEEVKVFGTFSILSRHKQLIGGTDVKAINKYVLALDDELRKTIVSEWMKLGYLQDGSV